MGAKKPYVIAVVIQLIYAGMFVVSKAAFDMGMNTFVFIFYRMVAASLLLLPIAIVLERKNVRSLSLVLLLKLFFYALIGNTFSLNLYNVSMKFTSATVASASSNSMPVVTICLALLLRMEVVKLRSLSGTAKVAGVALCLAGVFILAFYTGPALSPVNPHRAFAVAHATNSKIPSRMTWIKGTFFMVLANVTWALWIVLQGFVVTGVSYYLQAWCMEMKGPVFLAMWNPLCFVFTIFCSSFFLGEIVHLGSIVGGALLVGGLYSVLWAKSRETRITLMSSMAKMTDEMQDEQGHKKSQEKDDGNKEQEKSTSALGVEQV